MNSSAYVVFNTHAALKTLNKAMHVPNGNWSTFLKFAFITTIITIMAQSKETNTNELNLPKILFAFGLYKTYRK
jgi:L-asparagine transporter-like permease